MLLSGIASNCITAALLLKLRQRGSAWSSPLCSVAVAVVAPTPHQMRRHSECFQHRGARSRTAPPDTSRLSTASCLEDVAADRLSDCLPVIWQCEVDLTWDCWADYSGQQVQMLEAAWCSMCTHVELDAYDSYGGYDLWQVDLGCMLQVNSRTGTLRHIRRVLASHR